MRVDITARHFNLTDAIKSHIDEKLAKLKKYSQRAIEAHVVLTLERRRHTAEITFHIARNVFNVSETSDNLYISIDRSVGKLEKMLKRHKEKKYSKRSTKPELIVAEEELEEDEWEEEE